MTVDPDVPAALWDAQNRADRHRTSYAVVMDLATRALRVRPWRRRHQPNLRLLERVRPTPRQQ